MATLLVRCRYAVLAVVTDRIVTSHQFVTYHSCFSFFVDAISFSLRQSAHMDQDSSSPLPKGRKPMQAPISVDESPPVDARIKRVQRSPAGLTLEPSRRSYRGMQLQAELGSDGDSSSAGDNSSDDDDEPDLSYVSQGSQHSNAEAHVYALGQSSQGGFPTPMHLRRAADRNVYSVAGDIPTYHRPHLHYRHRVNRQHHQITIIIIIIRHITATTARGHLNL